MTRLEKIAALYIAITGDATPTAEELDAYAGLADTTTLEFISTKMGIDSGASAVYAALPEADVVDQLFINLFGYTADEITALKATEAGAEGFAYWVDQLVNNSTLINENTIAIALLNGAGEADTASALAIATDLASEYEDYTPEDVVPSVPGSDFFLTSNTDAGYAGATGIDTTGTDGDDSYYAYIQQNAGGVSNSLSSADHIDGGAGTDSLYAELSNEFLGEGSAGIAMTDVQPRTVDVEVVEIESRDADNAAGQGVTVDAKYMYGIDSIGSKNSDGDLVIENLNTLMDDKSTIRNTADITITMDHTDNFNSDGDASDLTVYFDEDYLVSGEETAGASLVIRMLNAVQNEADNNPVEGFSAITFNVGETEVTVDITSVATDDTLDYTTAYDAIVDLINAQLVADGFADVTAATAPIENAVFSIPVAGFTTGDSAGQYYPIVLTNAGAELLTGVDIDTAALSYDTDLNNSFNASAAVTTDVDLSVNVELTKVGNDGEGGNLIIGGKDQNASGDLDVDQTDGIDVFNITVMGDEDKPSNLGYIMSTDGALDTVNVASETRTDDSYAALTVTGETTTLDDPDTTDVNEFAGISPFGGTLTTFDADEFMGDLYIGQEVRASDINTFTAMGGGDVSLWATNTTVANSVDTGAGDDYLNIIDTGALDVNSGAGADELIITVGGVQTGNIILAGSGDDTLDIDGTAAIVDMGAGSDVVYTNSVALDVAGGTGDDVIYAQNTGAKAEFIYATSNLVESIAATATALDADANEVEFFDGVRVQVTLATDGVAAAESDNGYESQLVTINASSGSLTTYADINAAIVEAINDDAVLSNIATATIVGDDVVITYDVDGLQSANAVEIVFYPAVTTLAGSALETTIANEWEDAFNDSDEFVTGSEEENTVANLQTLAIAAANGIAPAFNASAADIAAAAADAAAVITVTNGVAALNTAIGSITFDTDDTTTIAAQTALTTQAVTDGFISAADKTAIDIAFAAADLDAADGDDTNDFNEGALVTAISDAQTALTSNNNINEATATAAASAATAALTDADALADAANQGSDSLTTGLDVNTVNGNAGDDVLVLGSNDAAGDILEITGYNQGDDTVVHFVSGVNEIDLSAYLDNTITDTTSAESAVDMDQVASGVDVDLALAANTVSLLDFSGDLSLDTAKDTVEFDDLTAAEVEAALETLASTTATANLFEDNAKSIVIVHNDEQNTTAEDTLGLTDGNEGEYKIFEVTYANDNEVTGDANFTVALIGQIDLGDEVLDAGDIIA